MRRALIIEDKYSCHVMFFPAQCIFVDSFKLTGSLLQKDRVSKSNTSLHFAFTSSTNRTNDRESCFTRESGLVHVGTTHTSWIFTLTTSKNDEYRDMHGWEGIKSSYVPCRVVIELASYAVTPEVKASRVYKSKKACDDVICKCTMNQFASGNSSNLTNTHIKINGLFALYMQPGAFWGRVRLYLSYVLSLFLLIVWNNTFIC